MLISEAYNLRLEELQTWKSAQTDYIQIYYIDFFSDIDFENLYR